MQTIKILNLIALSAFLIYGQPLCAMKALVEKQKQVSTARVSPKSDNTEEFAQAVYELHKFVFDHVTDANFESQWNAKFTEFNNKFPNKPPTATVSGPLDITYQANLAPIVEKLFHEIEESSLSSEWKWYNAFNAVLTLVKKIRDNNESAKHYTSDVRIKTYLDEFSRKFLAQAKKIALEQYAWPYYRDTNQITDMAEVKSIGRASTLQDLSAGNESIIAAETEQKKALKILQRSKSKEQEAVEQEEDIKMQKLVASATKSRQMMQSYAKKKNKKQKEESEEEEEEEEQPAPKKKQEKGESSKTAAAKKETYTEEEAINAVLALIQNTDIGETIYNWSKVTDQQKYKEFWEKITELETEYRSIYDQPMKNKKYLLAIQTITDLLWNGVPQTISDDIIEAIGVYISTDKKGSAIEEVNEVLKINDKKILTLLNTPSIKNLAIPVIDLAQKNITTLNPEAIRQDILLQLRLKIRDDVLSELDACFKERAYILLNQQEITLIGTLYDEAFQALQNEEASQVEEEALKQLLIEALKLYQSNVKKRVKITEDYALILEKTVLKQGDKLILKVGKVPEPYIKLLAENQIFKFHIPLFLALDDLENHAHHRFGPKNIKMYFKARESAYRKKVEFEPMLKKEAGKLENKRANVIENLTQTPAKIDVIANYFSTIVETPLAELKKDLAPDKPPKKKE